MTDPKQNEQVASFRSSFRERQLESIYTLSKDRKRRCLEKK